MGAAHLPDLTSVDFLFFFKHGTRKQHSSQPKADKCLSSTAHFFLLHRFGCCLSVVLQLDQRDSPENSHVVLCPNKRRSFEPLFFFLPQWAELIVSLSPGHTLIGLR